MDWLITQRRKLQRTVDVLHLRPLARRVFSGLLAIRCHGGRLVRAPQNGRVGWLAVTAIEVCFALANYEADPQDTSAAAQTH